MCQSAVPYAWYRTRVVSWNGLSLVDNGVFEVSPDHLQSLIHLSQVAYWFLVHTLPHAAANLICYSTCLRSRLLGSHNAGDVKPGVSWCKNPTVEHVHSAGALSCNGATVSMETTRVVLDPYRTFQPQSSCKWIMITCLPRSLITDLFCWCCFGIGIRFLRQ